MSHEYRNQVDIKNQVIIDELLNGMPDFVEDYYASMLAKERSTNTIKSYLYEINVFLRFVAAISHRDNVLDIIVSDLELVQKKDLEKYVARSEDGSSLTAPAKRRKLSVIKSFYKYYLQSELITKNPTISLEGARLSKKAVVTLNQDQVSTLLHVIECQENLGQHSVAYNERMVYRDLAIVMVFLGTGMRLSELVGLNVSDFDITNEKKTALHIIRKGGDDDTVYCVDQVRNAVMDYLDFSRPRLNPPESENALFVSVRGDRCSVSTIEKMLKKYCLAAGLPDNISPHKMRATFATKVYSETKDLYAVKDSLHHKSIDTSKNYISDEDARKERAADAVSGFFV
jgi:site-specific recombinase XerD